MNLDDLIQYISQESVLIGMQLKVRSFLLVRSGYVDQTFKNNEEEFEKFSFNNKLLSLHHLILNFATSKNTTTFWNHGLYGACQGSYIDLAELMIENGADNLDQAFYHACLGGHLSSVELLISKGVTHWNHGLSGACSGGHIDLADLMISKGAITWSCGSTLCSIFCREQIFD